MVREILNVAGERISTIKVWWEDYISLTDIAKSRSDRSDQVVQNWMKNRNTLEFLSLWEELNNSNFKPLQSEGFKKDVWLNAFLMSPKKWIDGVNAIWIVSRSWKHQGGTFAQSDIAFEFASWISPEFKLYLIKEFKRLKEIEQRRIDPQWSLNRILSKVNYQVQTDAIKRNIIDWKIENKIQQGFKYANEADLINMAIFWKTNKQWRGESWVVSKATNIRDYATMHELIVLSNCEYLNSVLIEKGMHSQERFDIILWEAQKQLQNIIHNTSAKKIEELKVW